MKEADEMHDRHGMRDMPPHQHMTFFWGARSEILFSDWPGDSSGMYALALLFVFALCVLVEWLSHCRPFLPVKPGVAAGVLRSLLHALRMGLAYLAMLALMSFNGGVFLAAVAGHLIGFMAFAKSEEVRPPLAGKADTTDPSQTTADLRWG